MRAFSFVFIGCLFMLSLVAAWLLPGTSVLADSFEDEGLPVYRNDNDYALVVTEYEATTKAELLDDDDPEHEIKLKALLSAPKGLDVLCFQTEMRVKSAEGDRGKELLEPKRQKEGKEYGAVLPIYGFNDRRGKPIALAGSELKDAALTRPAYEVEKITIEVNAVIVEKREEKEVPAIVADRLIDIGYDTEVQVTAMEVDNKGIMTVKMKVRRPPGTRAALVDSVLALDDDGDVVGGARWTNELELFDRDYDVELEFPLQGKPSIEKLRVVLATKYELKPIEFEVEGLFQR